VTTLTDRYVAAVLRSVPERSRTDIERELRASIADAIDARVEQGEARDAAETAVLTDLGDPSRLAAEYAGPARYLIGPSVYGSYLRTLGMVSAVLVPVSWLAVIAVWLAGGSGLFTSIVTASVVALFAALLVAFWTTLAYAVFERSAEVRAEMAEAFGAKPARWTPDRLPASTAIRPIRTNDAVEAIVGGTIGIALLFVQRSVSPFSDAAGQPIPFLNPGLWDFGSPWALVLVAVAVAWVAAEFVLLARGTWSVWLAIPLTAIQLASATIYIYLLASGQLFNPAFFEKLGAAPWVAPGSIPVLLLIFFSVVDAGQSIAKLWGAPIGGGPGKPMKPVPPKPAR
jgi:hypothetical protein